MQQIQICHVCQKPNNEPFCIIMDGCKCTREQINAQFEEYKNIKQYCPCCGARPHVDNANTRKKKIKKKRKKNKRK